MTGFVTRPDIEQGGIYDILAEYGALTGTSLPAALNTALPSALNSALPAILPPFIPPIISPLFDARGVLRPISEDQFPKQAGETDDTGMVQRALNWARDNRTTVAGIPNRRYILSSAVTAAPIYCGLWAQGAGFVQTVAGQNIFNFNNTATGDDNTGPNHSFRSHEMRHWDGFVLYGPGRAANGTIAMNMQNPSAGAMFSNFVIHECDTAWYWDDKGYIQHFDKFSVVHCNKLGVFRGLTGWDAGERISWTNGTFSNSDGGFDFARCQTYFHNVSMDYITSTNGNWLNLSNGADAFFTQSHLEGNQTTNYWGTVVGGSSLNFSSCTLIGSGAPAGQATRSTPWFQADFGSRSSVNFTGVNRFGATGPATSNGYGTMATIVDGPGRCDKLVFYNPGIPMPPSHNANNMFVDGPFGTGALRDWRNTSTGAGVANTSTAGEVITGSQSRKFAPAAGIIGRQETLLRVIDPNAQIFFAGNMLATGTPTEPFTFGFEFRSRTGESISNGNLVVSAAALTSTYATPAPFRAQPSIVPPRGASYVRVTMNKGAFDAASNGVGAVIVDDLVLNAPGCQVVASGEIGYPGWAAVQVTTTGQQFNVDDVVFVDTTAGAVTLSGINGVLRAGSRVRFVDKTGNWPTNNFIWSPGTPGVRGVAGNVTHNTAWQSITYEYNGTTWVQV